MAGRGKGDALREYRRKRHFNATPEPEGHVATRTEGGLRYVIQKHAATRLHFDLRLELDGVMKSWAVPKGPSLDPAVKRLAMQVEDHPMEYNAFEGTIPQGEYGGGTVMLWDQGHWEPIGDAHAGYEKGHLAFVLQGEKLAGAFDLVRIRGREARYARRGEEDGRTWLLIKRQDEGACTRAADESW